MLKRFDIQPDFKLSKNIFRKQGDKLEQNYLSKNEKIEISKSKVDSPFISSKIRKPVKIISKPLNYLKSPENDVTENLKKNFFDTSLPNLKQSHINLQDKQKKNVVK